MRVTLLAFVACAALAAPCAHAQGSEDLAKQLANPIASLVSVPFQLNYDHRIGPTSDGDRTTLNIQPVIPISLSPDWNLISRTIVPITYQDEIRPGAGSQFGLGDIVQSLFFSPKKPTSAGLIWAVGPVFLIPVGRWQVTSWRSALLAGFVSRLRKIRKRPPQLTV